MVDAAALKVIFLDIDGVLLPFPRDDENDNGNDNGNRQLFPSSTLKAFRSLLKKTDGAKIVLSSTWRVRQDFIQDIVENIRGFGSDKEEALEFEGFFDITDPTFHSERQWEIERWLSKNATKYNSSYNNTNYETIVWLALDDEELLEGSANQKFRKLFKGHVVKTQSDRGLTMDDVDHAMMLWNSQLQ